MSLSEVTFLSQREHTTETYREGWSVVHVHSDVTTTSGHESDDDDATYKAAL